MANQFTSGGGSRGPKKGHDEATKDKIRAEVMAKKLFKFAKAKPEQRDKLDMTTAQVQAAKILIDRGKPALQAIQQTTNTETPQSDQEIREALRALISANPEVARELNIGLRPVDSQAPAGHSDNESVASEQHKAA